MTVASSALAEECSAYEDRPRGPIRPRDVAEVEAALDAGMNPDPFGDEYSLLMFAAGDGDLALTRLLLSRGAQTEHRDHNQDRALLWAAQYGRVETVRLLLDAGSPPDSADDPYGATPLMKAARNGHAATACLLIARGSDISLRDQSDGTALHEAVLSRDPALVDLLLAAGANPNAKTESLEETPLHQAVFYGGPETVRLLLAAGADVGAPDHEGKSPLWHAAYHDLPETVALLLEAGAAADSRSNLGETPFAAAAGKSGAAARLLVERTGDLDGAFVAAMWGGHADLARRLRERGASLNGVDPSGRHALPAVVRHDGLAVLDWLMEERVDLGLQGPEALHEAAREGRADIVARLLASGVPADAPVGNGATALLAAAGGGHADIVRLLLEQGAGRAVRDSAGRDIEAYMIGSADALRGLIDWRQGTRNYRPTDELGDRLARLTAGHAQVRAMLAAHGAGP
jgi:ankyrin repeat protein